MGSLVRLDQHFQNFQSDGFGRLLTLMWKENVSKA